MKYILAITALITAPAFAEDKPEQKTIELSGHVENGIAELTLYAPPPECKHFYKCIKKYSAKS